MKFRIFPDYYKEGIFESFRLYWRSHGGFKALRRSPYLHLSIVATALSWPLWISGNTLWQDLIIDVIPNVLGFTLGGYAILLAFGDDKFLDLISGHFPDGEISTFLRVNGTFVHFIVVQVLSILFAVFTKIWAADYPFVAAIGLIMFYYAIILAIAAAMAILSLGNWFDIFRKHLQEEEKRESED